MAREASETELAVLGNARVYLRVAFERVAIASEHSRMLEPALEDLRAVDRLIRRTQASIAARAAGLGDSSSEKNS